MQESELRGLWHLAADRGLHAQEFSRLEEHWATHVVGLPFRRSLQQLFRDCFGILCKTSSEDPAEQKRRMPDAMSRHNLQKDAMSSQAVPQAESLTECTTNHYARSSATHQARPSCKSCVSLEFLYGMCLARGLSDNNPSSEVGGFSNASCRSHSLTSPHTLHRVVVLCGASSPDSKACPHMVGRETEDAINPDN